MRRLATIAAALVATLAWFAAGAIGEDGHTYRVELDNAFGITDGSQVRVAGVNVGEVTDVAVNADKRAEAEVEVSGELARLGTETECSSEPQSLIAEYFIDCDPAGPPLPEDGLIPVSQTRQTVQPDLVQATFREPFKQRLQMLITEFGTGLAGNAENLNAAIRRGAPALGELDEVIDTLADRNDTIAAMVGDSDRVLAELAERKDEVRRFVTEAREISDAGAARGVELSQSFERLDDFLGELTPTLSELRAVSQASEPLLARLQGSAGELSRFGDVFPDFADASTPALRSLGRSSVAATEAIEEGKQEIEDLKRSGRSAKRTTEPLKHFLRDVDDPRRIVEIDRRAERSCDDDTKPCWATGRQGPTGYTGLEGVLNYAYYLAGATNQVDQVSHIVHVSIYTVGDVGDPCGLGWWTGREADGTLTGVPKAGGGKTTDFLESDPCVSWLGKNQPGINQDLGLPPYDPAVCPNGSLAPELCDPGDSAAAAKRTKQISSGAGAGGGKQPAGPAAGDRDDDEPRGDGRNGDEPLGNLSGLGDLLGPIVGEDALGDLGDGLEDLGADPEGLGDGLRDGLGRSGRRNAPAGGLESLLELLIGGSG